MEYQKTNINAFTGLDNNARPELIKNEEASDIENLRYEKLGYLINRNGVENHSIVLSRQLNIQDIKGMLWSIGTMGLTEYVIEKPWGIGSGTQAVAPYDDATLNAFSPTVVGQNKYTDRFMVYALRIPAAKPGASNPRTDRNNESNIGNNGFPLDMANRYIWRYKAAYLLVPLTGPTGWRDDFAFAPNGNSLNGQYEPNDLSLPTLYSTMGARSIVRADDKPRMLQIYAPARWLGVHNQFSDAGVPKDLNWIEHYVSMQQYRDSIVISDMTNGDMYLVDEYSEAEYQDTKRHRFTLRQNALAHFDVDDVVVDFGIGVSAANGGNEGVKAPMALYKFYLKRSVFEQSQTNYQPYYSSVDKSPLIEKYKGNLSNWLPEVTSTFISTEYWQGEFNGNSVNACGIAINSTNKYVFSTQQEAVEYDDLFAPLTLHNPDIKEDDQTSTDVYLWKDLKIDYYPVSGSKQSDIFLTGLDRKWDKTNSAGTKIVKLTTHAGIEQEVPLGVWRYRFVWYMGNGEYSAPSSELVLPDLLFSGLKNSDIIDAYGSYKRPVGIENFNEAEQASKVNPDVLLGPDPLNNSSRIQGIKLRTTDAFGLPGPLTAYGQSFLNIKKALYEPSHVFAAKYSSTSGLSWPVFNSTETDFSINQLGVVCTLFWPGNSVPLSGVQVETANSTLESDKGGQKNYPLERLTNYSSSAISINIPLFRDSGQGSQTYNSVFTDYGNLRTAYQNTTRNSTAPLYDVNFPAYQIVFEGTQRYGADEPIDGNNGRGWVGSDVVKSGLEAWFNLVPFKGGKPLVGTWLGVDYYYEHNNIVDSSLVYNSIGVQTGTEKDFRTQTQVRGVNKQADRLTYIKAGLPAEVISRIVLSGSGEIPLCNFGDKGTWTSQKQMFPINNYGDDNLEHTDVRTFTLTNAQVYFNINTNYFPTRTYNQFIIAPYVTGTIRFDNIRVILTGIGERLTIPEQLSMYVPASLLFNAPHVKLVIPSERVPRRARQLLVFRTRATHDNAWQPHDYGLVKTIDLARDANGKLTGNHATKIEFLDDVKSDELDYTYSIPDYDGFTQPIKSRFCLPLNERVFYANIKESYKPHSPRNAVKIEDNNVVPDTLRIKAHKNLNVGTNTEIERLWSYRLVSEGAPPPNTVNINRQYLYYFTAYNDQARSFSLSSTSGPINRGASTTVKPLMYCLPSAYDTSVEHLNIYRLQLDAAIPEVKMSSSRIYDLTTNSEANGEVFYVVQGLVEYHGKVYYPNDVIQTAWGNDVGYDGSRANKFFNYFDITGATNTTDRGWPLSYSQPILYKITPYFDGAAGPQYIEKIGTIKPEDEGIFYDNDLPSLGRLPLKQIFQNEDVMPAGLRWSEPYQPNKIKLGSLMEVRSGDGDQITGLAMLYGNLIVLKERSIHRLAVQGAAVPVSRVDEISNNVGCIAPNTAITVNNTLYFLSWAGFYKYDNNQLSKIDGKFSEELQLRLRSSQNGVINPAIRDASCGWNPTYRELYLTIPVMSTSSNEGDHTGANTMGVTITDNKGTRDIRGITYAINIDTGFVTKYRYMDDAVYFTDPSTWMQQLYPAAPTQRAPRVYSRLYYTNTLGQMRSAETLPPRTIHYLNPTMPLANDASTEFMRISMFIESPTKDANNRDKSNDDHLMFIQNLASQYVTINATKFVRVFWASKSWTAEDKSVLKRIRKVFSYIAASDDPVILRGIVHTSPEGETVTTDNTWQYTYVDSRPASPRFNYSVTGEVMAVPTESAGQTSSPSQNRGERHTFHVEGSGAFQMEYFGFYWKPINQYER